MTPKEKAEELVSKMLQYQPLPEKGFVNEKTFFDNAKQCAIICVDEIIAFGNKLKVREPMMFWVAVKKELNLIKR